MALFYTLLSISLLFLILIEVEALRNLNWNFIKSRRLLLHTQLKVLLVLQFKWALPWYLYLILHTIVVPNLAQRGITAKTNPTFFMILSGDTGFPANHLLFRYPDSLVHSTASTWALGFQPSLDPSSTWQTRHPGVTSRTRLILIFTSHMTFLLSGHFIIYYFRYLRI